MKIEKVDTIERLLRIATELPEGEDHLIRYVGDGGILATGAIILSHKDGYFLRLEIHGDQRMAHVWRGGARYIEREMTKLLKAR